VESTSGTAVCRPLSKVPDQGELGRRVIRPDDVDQRTMAAGESPVADHMLFE